MDCYFHRLISPDRRLRWSLRRFSQIHMDLGFHVYILTILLQAKQVQGYEVGNRYRLVAVMRLELVMIYLSLLIYLHLFSYFHRSPVESQNVNKESRDVEGFRKKCFWIFMGVMIGAHVTYMFYFLPFDVPYIIYWPAALSLGLWMHLFFFTCLFMGGNTVVAALNVGFIY